MEYQSWSASSSEDTRPFNGPISPDGHDSSLFGILLDASKLDSAKSEIEQYLSEPLSPPTTCPIKFWEGNSSRFKTIAMIARKYLAIPATSAEVERIFSISGWLARSRRSSITPDNVARLLMIRDESNEDFTKRGVKRKAKDD